MPTQCPNLCPNEDTATTSFFQCLRMTTNQLLLFNKQQVYLLHFAHYICCLVKIKLLVLSWGQHTLSCLERFDSVFAAMVVVLAAIKNKLQFLNPFLQPKLLIIPLFPHPPQKMSADVRACKNGKHWAWGSVVTIVCLLLSAQCKL